MHVMDSQHHTDCPPEEDANFWKNKYKDLEERFTVEMEQMEMKWRFTLKRVEERRSKLETFCLRVKGRDKGVPAFAKHESPAELEEMWLKEVRFQSVIRQLEERNQRHIYELEQKDERWKSKVMELEKENDILAEKAKFWRRKAKKVELLKELAEKHERWEKRVHQINEEKRRAKVRAWKAKVKKLKKENTLRAHQDVGNAAAEVKTQQARDEELMEEQQSSGRQIKELKNKNSRLVQKVGSLEKRIKRLEAEKELVQKFQRWEKKVEELRENKRRNKREKAKAQIKELIKTNRELDKAWKRKVERLKAKKKRAASAIQSLETTIKELKMKFNRPVMGEERVEAREETSQQAPKQTGRIKGQTKGQQRKRHSNLSSSREG